MTKLLTLTTLLMALAMTSSTQPIAPFAPQGHDDGILPRPCADMGDCPPPEDQGPGFPLPDCAPPLPACPD